MFRVRPALPSDVPRIAPWTRETFSWGDYVADSLAAWIESPSLEVLVCVEDDDIPMAVSLVQMLSEREGWLSAARVHPAAQRIGLGSLLNQASVAWIAANGGVVARLAVERTNTAASNQVRKLGYRAGSTWAFGRQADNQPKPTDHGDKPEIAGRSDVDPAWMYWSTSEIADAGRMLIPSAWKWRRATTGDIDRAARERRLVSNAAGWLIVEPGEDGSVEVVWVAAGRSDFPRLVSTARRFASEQGYSEVRFKIPETGWSGEALRRDGFEVSEIVVYAKPVTL